LVTFFIRVKKVTRSSRSEINAWSHAINRKDNMATIKAG